MMDATVTVYTHSFHSGHWHGNPALRMANRISAGNRTAAQELAA
jgi:hypothetical protein